MIKTLYQFGQQLQKMDDMQSYFEIFGSPYSERAEGEKVIVAVINAKSFQGLEIDEYRKTWNSKYLFRELAAARSTSIVPTLHFYNIPQGENVTAKTEKELDDSIEKFYDKISRSIEANSAIYEKYFDQKEFLKKVKTEIKDFSIKNLGEKKNYLFTFKIDNQWLGDILDIKKILEDEAYNKYFSSKGEDFKSSNKVCAVTYKPVEEVWGRVDTLGFTVNDIAFSRNGFDARNSYKMFPVSPEAVKVLEGTRRILDNYFSVGFHNLRFFVIPRFTTIENEDTKFEITEIFTQKAPKKHTDTADSQLEAIISSEKIFAEIIEEDKLDSNSIHYDIFFFEEKQAQFSIKIHITDVIPTRFRDIIDAKKQIQNKYDIITRIVTKKQDVYHFNLIFTEIKKYLPEPFFFQIMEAIFYKNPVKKKLVLEAFMQLIVIAFKNQHEDAYKFDQTVKRTFVIYQYFQTLQLFDKMEKIQQKEPLILNAEGFVKQHPFFDNELKKASFYLGCAVEMILQAQRDDLKSEPFKHKLNGLNIDYNKLMEIEHKAKNKAEEYKESFKNRKDRFFPSKEFELAITNFGYSWGKSNKESATKTEISFCFSLGLSMEKHFRYNRLEEHKNKPQTEEE